MPENRAPTGASMTPARSRSTGPRRPDADRDVDHKAESIWPPRLTRTNGALDPVAPGDAPRPADSALSGPTRASVANSALPRRARPTAAPSRRPGMTGDVSRARCRPGCSGTRLGRRPRALPGARPAPYRAHALPTSQDVRSQTLEAQAHGAGIVTAGAGGGQAPRRSEGLTAGSSIGNQPSGRTQGCLGRDGPPRRPTGHPSLLWTWFETRS